MRNAILLGGAPRSGTTVLHALVCTSQRTNSYVAECMLTRPLFQTFIAGMNSSPRHISHFFPDHDEYYRFTKGLIAQAFDVLWENLDKPELLTLKDPLLTPEFPRLAPHFPEIKFIVIVRHPVDILRSRQEVFYKLHPKLQFGLNQVAGIMQEWVKCSSFQPRDNILILRYEEIGSQQFMDDLMNFTGLNDLEPHRLWEGIPPSSEKKNPWHSPLYGKQIEVSKRNRDVQFSDEIMRQVRKIAGELAKQFGYQLD